jgi:hypothetical protein
MIRLATIAWLLLVAASGYAMFQVKYEVAKLEQQLAQVDRGIAESREQTRVLSAEWSLLNDPRRLDQLAHRYLDLRPLLPKQLASIDSLPRRSQTPPAAVAVAPSPVASLPAAAPRLASNKPETTP